MTLSPPKEFTTKNSPENMAVPNVIITLHYDHTIDRGFIRVYTYT